VINTEKRVKRVKRENVKVVLTLSDQHDVDSTDQA